MVTETKIEPNFDSNIVKFYEGTSIFITGGSGFLGKLLIEKLLRTCPGLTKLYILIRPKKGKTSEQRLEEMFQDSVFERMIKEQPKYSEKIILIIGDLVQPDLGINEEDKKLLAREVNVVFHLAATVRFDEPLRKASVINVRATKDLVEFAKTIANLKVFVHVSTAYSHPYRKQIDEDIYDVPISCDKLLNIIEMLNDDELVYLTPKLCENWPNTYSFTKAIVEKYIEESGKGLPIIIIRPSMIISTFKEPVESWINNYYGPVGITMAVAAGFLRAAHVNQDCVGDMVPADYVVNSLIVAGGHMGNKFNENKTTPNENNVIFDELKFSSDVPVFNYTSISENPLTWRKFCSMSFEYSLTKWYTIHTIWYIFFIMTPYRNLQKVLQFFLHKIPAYVVDIFLCLTGKKPMMVALYAKLDTFHDSISYFSTNEWNFNNKNTQMLWKLQNTTDQELFPFSMKEVNWVDYFQMYGKGLRLYLFKDPLETLPQSKIRYQRLKIAHYTVVTLFWLFVAYVTFRICQALLL